EAQRALERPVRAHLGPLRLDRPPEAHRHLVQHLTRQRPLLRPHRPRRRRRTLRRTPLLGELPEHHIRALRQVTGDRHPPTTHIARRVEPGPPHHHGVTPRDLRPLQRRHPISSEHLHRRLPHRNLRLGRLVDDGERHGQLLVGGDHPTGGVGVHPQHPVGDRPTILRLGDGQRGLERPVRAHLGPLRLDRPPEAHRHLVQHLTRHRPLLRPHRPRRRRRTLRRTPLLGELPEHHIRALRQVTGDRHPPTTHIARRVEPGPPHHHGVTPRDLRPLQRRHPISSEHLHRRLPHRNLRLGRLVDDGERHGQLLVGGDHPTGGVGVHPQHPVGDRPTILRLDDGQRGLERPVRAHLGPLRLDRPPEAHRHLVQHLTRPRPLLRPHRPRRRRRTLRRTPLLGELPEHHTPALRQVTGDRHPPTTHIARRVEPGPPHHHGVTPRDLRPLQRRHPISSEHLHRRLPHRNLRLGRLVDDGERHGQLLVGVDHPTGGVGVHPQHPVGDRPTILRLGDGQRGLERPVRAHLGPLRLDRPPEAHRHLVQHLTRQRPLLRPHRPRRRRRTLRRTPLLGELPEHHIRALRQVTGDRHPPTTHIARRVEPGP